MKKIIGFCISMLLITIVLPASIAKVESYKTFEDDFEITISTGFRGKNIGHRITVDMLNHKTEDVTVLFNLKLNYLFTDHMDGNYPFNYTLSPEIPVYYHVSLIPCYPDGIKFLTISAEVDDKIVTKSGISIRQFVCLYD